MRHDMKMVERDCEDRWGAVDGRAAGGMLVVWRREVVHVVQFARMPLTVVRNSLLHSDVAHVQAQAATRYAPCAPRAMDLRLLDIHV